MEDHIVQPEVPVHDASLITRRDMQRRPFDEPLHRRNILGLRGSILSRPTLHLALNIAAGATVIAHAESYRDEREQPNKHSIHLGIDARPGILRQRRESRIPEDPTLHILHYKECGPDDRGI